MTGTKAFWADTTAHAETFFPSSIFCFTARSKVRAVYVISTHLPQGDSNIYLLFFGVLVKWTSSQKHLFNSIAIFFPLQHSSYCLFLTRMWTGYQMLCEILALFKSWQCKTCWFGFVDLVFRKKRISCNFCRRMGQKSLPETGNSAEGEEKGQLEQREAKLYTKPWYFRMQ